MKRLRLAVEIVKRPQAVGTQGRVDQPPHRILDCAFHLTGVLLRKHRIANHGERVNAEITELQKIRNEKRNFLSRWLNNPRDRRHRRDRASSPSSENPSPQRTLSITEVFDSLALSGSALCCSVSSVIRSPITAMTGDVGDSDIFF